MLLKNMPVALVDHIDRNPEKQLLRGRVGYIEGWVLHPGESSQFQDGVRILKKPPKVVFVRFQERVGEGANARWEDCKWVVCDLPLGVYPIPARPRSWYLDQKRQRPVLRVKREQIPLAPYFSITAHAAQGQTLQAAIVDLQIGRCVSVVASYIA